MITLPQGFTATKYPGYFWHTEEQVLYSIKIGGVLRRIKLTTPNFHNKLWEPAYRVSVEGVRTVLPLSELQKLTLQDSEIPVQGQTK